MKLSAVYFAVAMLAPIILFVGVLDNANERFPMLVYLLCVILFATAGYLSSCTDKPKTQKQWVAWSIVAGLFEATLLVFGV